MKTIKKEIVIFGNGEIAKLAHLFFHKFSNYKIVAFAVDKKYQKSNSFLNLPLVDVEDIAKLYPPENFDAFIALSYNKFNLLREQKYLYFKSLSYKLVSFIHPSSVISDDVDIGENCFILENQLIQPFSKIDNNVTLWSGNHIGHGSIISSHSWISSQVVISGNVKIGEKCFLGVNCSLRDNITVGNDVMIGMGANVTSNIKDGEVVISENSRIFSQDSKQASFIKRKFFNM